MTQSNTRCPEKQGYCKLNGLGLMGESLTSLLCNLQCHQGVLYI